MLLREGEFSGPMMALRRLAPFAYGGADGIGSVGFVRDRFAREPVGGGAPGHQGAADARHYTVRPGDNLSAIAGKQLGDASRWKELYDANRDQLSNPNVISVGMTLRLPGEGAPAAPATATASAAPARPEAKTPGGWLWDLAREIGHRHGVEPHLLMAIVQQESQGHPGAVSPAGALGLMQLMPDTARQLGVKAPLNARQNMDGGARYIKGLLDYYRGNLTLALAAYNAGAGNVDRYGGIPPFGETRAYVPAVLANLREYRTMTA